MNDISTVVSATDHKKRDFSLHVVSKIDIELDLCCFLGTYVYLLCGLNPL